ncbi:phosphate ABC transporter ATP-binding protein [Rhodococcus aerolatus]
MSSSTQHGTSGDRDAVEDTDVHDVLVDDGPAMDTGLWSEPGRRDNGGHDTALLTHQDPYGLEPDPELAAEPEVPEGTRQVGPITLVGAPPPGAATIDAVGVHAWFGSRLVLEDVNLRMPANKVTALIGPSGCGKSTFLRILNRMHELVPAAQLAGEVRLDGEDIYASTMRAQHVRARIGMVFQKPNPFPAMSIRENVLAGLKLGGIRTRQRDDLVELSLQRAGLWKEVRNRLDTPGGALSGGQQQRLCIARSLAVRPNVLLMDEPCSALDPTSTRRIEQTIAEIGEEITVIIVTHNMQQAQRVSDYCAFFLAAENQPGVVVEHGETETIFGSPEDPRTDDYVNGVFG